MDEFEQAALISSNPAQVTQVEALMKANQYLFQLMESPDGWRFCCQKLFTSSVLQAKFVCFQALVDLLQQRYQNLSQEDKLFLKESLMKWLKEYVPNHPQEDIALKNKFAQVLVLLFMNEYPKGWPTFFKEMFALLQVGPVMVDMFLRIIEAIDRNIISKESHRSPGDIGLSAQIKDGMREDCIPTLVEVFYTVTVNYRAPLPAVANTCLLAMKPYIEWIDIQFVINERFLMLFYELLGDENLRLSSCECLREVVKKGMDPIPKLELLAKIKILQVLGSVEATEINFQRALAVLLDDTGEALIVGWNHLLKLLKENQIPRELEETGRKMVEEGLPILWKYLGAKDYTTSTNVLDFACDYMRTLRSLPQLSDAQVDHLQTILKIATNKMKYPDGFKFDANDEAEALFIQHRKEIGGLVKKVMKISPQLVAAFVHSALSTAITNVRTLPVADVEVAVSLLCCLGDGLSTLSDEVKLAMVAFFSKIMPLVIASDLSAHPHKAVALVTLETIEKYVRHIPSDQPDVAKGVLATLLTERGIRHKDMQVRCRACYIFAQFVKNHKQHLAPFIGDVVNSLKELLDISPNVQNYLPFPYQVNLFDAVGSLIAANSQDQMRYLEILMGPPLTQMNEIMTKQLYKTDTPENPVYVTLLANIITALVNLNKGFTRVPKEKSEVWLRVLDNVLKVAAAIDAPEIRQCVVGFLHRMVESVGKEMFPYIPFALNILMEKRGIGEILEFLRLVTQFASRFKQEIAPVMNEVLVTIVQRVHEITSVPTNPRSEEAREQYEVLKGYYTFIRAVLQNNLAVVLFSEKNQPHTETILRTILMGLDARDVPLQRLTMDVMIKLSDLWCGEGKGGWPGMQAFLFQQLVPHIFKVMFTPSFNPDDANCSNLLDDFANVQYLMRERYGTEFQQYLSSTLLPSLGFQQEAFLQHYLMVLESKQLKAFLKEFITAHRRK